MEHEQKTNCGAGGHRAARERIAAALGAAAAALAAHPDPLPAIDRAVARHYGVPVAALASRDRAPAAARARRAAWALGYAGARAPARTLCRRYGGRRVEGVLRAVERAAGGLSPGGAAELAALAWRACADGAAAADCRPAFPRSRGRCSRDRHSRPVAAAAALSYLRTGVPQRRAAQPHV